MEEKGEMSEKHIITERKLTETFSKFATLLGTQDCTPDSLYTLVIICFYKKVFKQLAFFSNYLV